ncbi:MAG: ribonuclease Y [Calditrichaeota bacterium]|nr:MAG: ribonuclease Y [Calditrichota bacterium]
MNEVIWILVGLGLFVTGWFVSNIYYKIKYKKARKTAEEIIAEAEREAERAKHKAVIQAKEKWYAVRDEQEKRIKAKQRKLDDLERQLLDTERSLSRKENLLNHKENKLLALERKLEDRKESLKNKEAELDRIIQQQNATLSRVAQLSIEEAKQLLLENLSKEYKAEAAQIYKELVDTARENALKEARKIITMAIEKSAADHCVETTVSVVNLPSEEVKGRIIGKDGRNIKAFEMATGIKVIVDDTPEAVVLSGFDPVKREVARIALENLIRSNKINPQRIEDVVKDAEEEVEKLIWRAGNEAVAKVGVGRMHPELIRMLGRLKYRTSYGQNVLQHSIEVATLVGAMAAELKLDVKLARRAGLLHDIGKAVSQNAEGTHTQLGVEIAKKYKEDPVVINAIASHHEDVPATSLISVLVSAADSISGSRPGARRDTLDGYIRRIESIEKVADSFDLVAKAYAISAGREVRVMVKPEKVTDAEAELLARDIAKKIESDLEYPGQIKVTVIRESRAVSYTE